MSFIFLDESGDLGFNPKKKNSKYFVITILSIEDKKTLEKIVRKVHRSLRKKIKRVGGGVLHSVKEKPKTRRKLLALIAKEDCRIMTISLKKEKVYTRLKDEKHVLYNYVTNILLDRIMTKKLISKDSKSNLVAEKRETNKFLNENFKTYLLKQIKNKFGLELEIEVKSPREEKALQAVDFVSWAIFRKYERKDSSYCELIKGRIVEENPLFG